MEYLTDPLELEQEGDLLSGIGQDEQPKDVEEVECEAAKIGGYCPNLASCNGYSGG